MLRVMLVDDEPLALEGLELLIDWQKEGFAVCAACGSGREALALWAEARPHLIVTDIRMADMDGMRLMERARAAGYTGAFLIVSGYGDFEYAKEAMRLGVAGYLLKPIDPGEAAQVLERVRKEWIERALREELPLAAYRQAVTALLSGQEYDKAILPSGQWQLLTWGVPLPYDGVAAVVEGFAAQGIRATTHVVEGTEWLVLYAPDASLEAASRTALERMLGQNGRIHAASPIAETPDRLPQLRRMICSQLELGGAELARRVQALADAVALLQAEAFDRLAGALLADCLLRGKAAQVQAEQLFYAACGQLLAAQPEKLRIFLRSPVRGLHAVGLLALRLLTPVPLRLSDQVQAYLETRYAAPLTLGTVAEALGYSASHLGQVFRAETGMGFHPYLNRLRIQKAATLLADSALPVHEVAEAVGYGQYKRFLAHFKQYLGMTPKAYRQNDAAKKHIALDSNS